MPNGYIVIGLIFGAFIAGLLFGYHYKSLVDDAVQLQFVDSQVAKQKKEQAAIDQDEAKAAVGIAATNKQTIQLTGELKHGKNLTDCKLDSSTINILHKASLPVTKLP